MVQWVQNPTAVALVAAEAQVRSLAQELPYAGGVAIMNKHPPPKKNPKVNIFQIVHVGHLSID